MLAARHPRAVLSGTMTPEPEEACHMPMALLHPWEGCTLLRQTTSLRGKGALRLVLLNARAWDNDKVRASDPLARALHGHALTAGAHLDLPSSESFSWAVSACSSSGRDTGGQRSRARAGLSFCHLKSMGQHADAQNFTHHFLLP